MHVFTECVLKLLISRSAWRQLRDHQLEGLLLLQRIQV